MSVVKFAGKVKGIGHSAQITVLLLFLPQGALAILTTLYLRQHKQV